MVHQQKEKERVAYWCMPQQGYIYHFCLQTIWLYHIKKIFLFIFSHWIFAVLSLRCCRGLSRWGEQGLLWWCTGSSLGWLPLWSTGPRHKGFSSRGHVLSSFGCQALNTGVAASRMWDLLDQGLNLCLLHWQVDSLPLSYQGSPHILFFINLDFSQFLAIMINAIINMHV